MSLRLQSPEWLWLCVLILPMALVGWRWFSGMSRVRRVTAIGARALLIILLALMLAGVTSVRTSDRLGVVAVIDVSGSVRAFVPERAAGGAGEAGPSGQPPRSAIEQVRTWLRTAAGARGPEDLVGIVVFDGVAVTVATPRPGRERGDPAALDPERDVLARPLDIVTSEGSDLASALRLGAAILPPDAGRRLVLFSDGNQTSGDALGAARALAPARGVGGAGRGTPIDVVPLVYRVESEVIVEAVDVPSHAPAEATVTARVRLWSAAPARGLLRLQVEGRDIPIGEGGQAGRAVTLSAGVNTVLVNVPLNAGRIHRFAAIFEPEMPAVPGDAPATGSADRLASNNRAEGVTITPGNGTILVLDGFSQGGEGAGALLPSVLRRRGLDVQVKGPGELPEDLLELEKYDLVVLHNVSAGDVSERAQGMLARYVTELGGGLVMIGGPQAFGAGGWKGSPVESILPVRLDLPEELIVPSAAVVIVMDTSGSMGLRVLGGSRTQQEIANEGAAIAIRSLDKNDLVGVIQFDNTASVVVPVQRAGDTEAIAREVLSLSPGGGTNLPPALREAWDQLRSVEAQVKHVIVLSDGRSQDAERIPFIAEQMLQKDGIRVSAISVGDLADVSGMNAMAKMGGGTSYVVSDPATLPRLFLKAVQVIRTPMIREKPFVPVVRDASSPLIAGLTGSDMPALNGLVLTMPRGDDPLPGGVPRSALMGGAATAGGGVAGRERGAEPRGGGSLGGRLGGSLGGAGVTYALITPQGEPLLAHWQAGLGQVAAFTSDAAVWAEPWVQWAGYGQLWTQVARTIARPSTGRNVELRAVVEGETLRLHLEAADESGQARDGLSVRGAVYAPDGTRSEVQLVQTGPGTYEGAAPAPGSGTYVVTLTPAPGTGGGERLPPVIGAATRAVGAEYRDLASNEGLLRQIAQITGGRVLSLDAPQKANLFDRAGLLPQEARLPLWPLVLPVALVVLWLDVGTRRVAWDRLLSREYGASLVRDAAAVVAQRGRQAAGTLGGLRQREAAMAQSAAGQAGAALGGDEAARVAAAARARRVAEREQARAARAASGSSPVSGTGPSPAPRAESASGSAPSRGGEPSASPASARESLAAAKRRARERLGE